MPNKFKKYAILALILLAVLEVYLYTMQPVFKNDDSPETAADAYTLAIAHPPGYPLFTMAAKVFTLLPFATPVFRVNLFSAFLALLILLMTYFIIRQNTIIVFKDGGSGTGYIELFILAFSLIFWDQAIEAKGAIYMLNLLLLSALIYISLIFFYNYNIKHLYLISYIYGLSLTNHWPSMIILAPVFIYFLIKYFEKLNFKVMTSAFVFFLLGISPYIYLPVRASGQPIFNMGNPDSLQNLLWVIMRKGYTVPVEPSLHLYIYQIKEFLKLFFTNFLFLWIFALPGFYIIFKKARRIFYFYTGIFFIVIIMVIFYNRTKEEIKWIIDIFLMPAEFALLPAISSGIIFTYGMFRKKIIKYLMAAAVVLLIISEVNVNFYSNNSRYDYLSYDFGNNILQTLDKGSVYLGEGDYNLMPLYYIQTVQGRAADIKFVTLTFLIFKWGIDDFVKKYGNIPLRDHDLNFCVPSIVDNFIDRNTIYRSSYSSIIDAAKLKYVQKQKGLLLKILKKDEYIPPYIYQLYSYRGVNDRSLANKRNTDLITWYPVCMVNQGNALLGEKRYNESIGLYKKALAFNVKKPENGIYYNMSLAYRGMGDVDSELECLDKAIEKQRDFLPAYETAGFIYYHIKNLPKAREMFETALKLGSRNEKINEAIKIIDSIDISTQFEMILAEANKSIEKKDYKHAFFLYNFLIEKKYKTAIIFRNIGVYYFETGNLPTALENFEKSKNETPTPEIYLYIAFIYYKMDRINDAISVLEESFKLFGQKEDQRSQLYRQLKQVNIKNDKSTNSINR